jgi:glycosyltransferase involved in cell wall biosynthesis
MAAGRPVVASRIGGIPELIEDGKTGLLVDAGDKTGLAEGILKLLTDRVLYSQLVENALLKASQQFDLRQQVAKFRDLYEEILG